MNVLGLFLFLGSSIFATDFKKEENLVNSGHFANSCFGECSWNNGGDRPLGMLCSWPRDSSVSRNHGCLELVAPP